ncbi:MAG: hypothetical protein HDR26_07080 [Lachnospiraceae bacterium]|nr:hypothetical protein [Lachnospiraceae bacterium]
MELLGKLDRLLADGRFRSKNEVLRKGIALAYEACYEAPGGSRGAAGLTEHEIREASKMIAEEIISRIGGSISESFGSCSLPKETEKMTDEMASFLSGLNSGG